VTENLSIVKVSVAGDGNVGKTSLIRFYTQGRFEISRVATIGVDFQIHTEQLPQGSVKLSIWDMAGQERFQFLRADFYRGSLAAALVYDVTAPETVDHLGGWREEIARVVPDVRFMVVGNKIDLERVSDSQMARDFARKLGYPYLETSALSGKGVAEMFHTLALLATNNLG
jgi:small GTP-binding protein